MIESPSCPGFAGWVDKPSKGAGSRNKFSKGEDDLLRQLVAQHGESSWPKVAASMKNRTARQCRERYNNYLSPRITNGPWTPEEDQLLASKFAEFGNSWAKIAQSFDRRSDVNVKNRWTTLQSRGKTRTQPQIPPRPLVQPPFYAVPALPAGYYPFYYPPGIYSVPIPMPPPPARPLPRPPAMRAPEPPAPPGPAVVAINTEPTVPDPQKQPVKRPLEMSVEKEAEKESPVTQGEFENTDDPWSYYNWPDTSYPCWQ
jgi:hypothetical protein